MLRGHVEGTTGAELHISGFPRVQKKCGAVFPQIWGSIRSEEHFGELFSASFPSSLHRCSHHLSLNHKYTKDRKSVV